MRWFSLSEWATSAECWESPLLRSHEEILVRIIKLRSANIALICQLLVKNAFLKEWRRSFIGSIRIEEIWVIHHNLVTISIVWTRWKHGHHILIIGMVTLGELHLVELIPKVVFIILVKFVIWAFSLLKPVIIVVLLFDHFGLFWASVHVESGIVKDDVAPDFGRHSVFLEFIACMWCILRNDIDPRIVIAIPHICYLLNFLLRLRDLPYSFHRHYI